ncbi:MAG: DNA polymerase IV [Eubacteriaceae bacterium]|nr:DNA polymerase IV [Eubacteriaceae bacterium]
MKITIFLVDMNSFFISCEGTRHPEITGKPAAVAGDPKNRTGIILTSNYEARKFGVKTAMVVHEALRLCPDLILIPPDHRFYGQKSREVMEILSDFTPVIEQNSIDEAWLDMTGCEGIFGKPAESAIKIMERLKNELGLWCSIGISENKFLAKMASDMKKPLGITELWKEDIALKLWPLPVRSMYGVGKQTAKKLQSIGIMTIGDLARINEDILSRNLGKSGMEFHRLANGVDNSPVITHSHDDVKSISRSVTLAEDITDFEKAKIVLLRLSDEISTNARRHGKKGRTVQISIKYADFESITRQTTVPETFLSQEIYTAAHELLKKIWNTDLPVRLLGVSLTGFSKADHSAEATQLSLFNLPEIHSSLETSVNTENIIKQDLLEGTIDELRQKYGASMIKRAVLMKKQE